MDRKLEIREFALCRMSEAVNTGEVFTPTTPFDVQATLDRSFGAHTSGTPELVQVRFKAETAVLIRERDWHETEEKEELPGGELLYTMHVPVCPEVVRWILSFGSGATVLQPAKLAAKIKGEGSGIQGNYCSDESRSTSNIEHSTFKRSKRLRRFGSKGRRGVGGFRGG